MRSDDGRGGPNTNVVGFAGRTLALVEAGVMDLSTAIARLTWGPAQILGLPLGRLDLASGDSRRVTSRKAAWPARFDWLVRPQAAPRAFLRATPGMPRRAR